MEKNIDKKTLKKVNCPAGQKISWALQKSDEIKITPLEREKITLVLEIPVLELNKLKPWGKILA